MIAILVVLVLVIVLIFFLSTKNRRIKLLSGIVRSFKFLSFYFLKLAAYATALALAMLISRYLQPIRLLELFFWKVLKSKIDIDIPTLEFNGWVILILLLLVPLSWFLYYLASKALNWFDYKFKDFFLRRQIALEGKEGIIVFIKSSVRRERIVSEINHIRRVLFGIFGFVYLGYNIFLQILSIALLITKVGFFVIIFFIAVEFSLMAILRIGWIKSLNTLIVREIIEHGQLVYLTNKSLIILKTKVFTYMPRFAPVKKNESPGVKKEVRWLWPRKIAYSNLVMTDKDIYPSAELIWDQKYVTLLLNAPVGAGEAHELKLPGLPSWVAELILDKAARHKYIRENFPDLPVDDQPPAFPPLRKEPEEQFTVQLGGENKDNI